MAVPWVILGRVPRIAAASAAWSRGTTPKPTPPTSLLRSRCRRGSLCSPRPGACTLTPHGPTGTPTSSPPAPGTCSLASPPPRSTGLAHAGTCMARPRRGCGGDGHEQRFSGGEAKMAWTRRGLRRGCVCVRMLGMAEARCDGMGLRLGEAVRVVRCAPRAFVDRPQQGPTLTCARRRALEHGKRTWRVKVRWGSGRQTKRHGLWARRGHERVRAST